MKKLINSFFKMINDEFLEQFSFIILLLWAISPIIEYIFKNYAFKLYTSYFSFITVIIGSFGIICYLFYFLKMREKKRINIKSFIPELLIIVLLIISIISSILSKNSYLSIFGDGYRKEGLIVYVMYIGVVLLASIIKNSKYIKYLFKTIIASCLIITILPLFKDNFTYVGFANVFRQFNHYGYYLMINVMLSAFMFIESNKVIKKIIYSLIYVFFIFLLIRNDTFGSFLAIIISFVFLFIYSMVKKYQRKNVLIVLLIFIITVFSVSHFDIKIGERVNFKSRQGIVGKNIKEFSTDVKNIVNKDEVGTEKAGTGRGLLWKEAINYTLDHPIIGGGMESLKKHYLANGVDYSDRPHNIILQVSSFIGIPGAIIYLSLILYLAITNLKLMNQDTIHIMVYFTAMCYFISSLFGNSMYYTSPYFMILLGFLIGFNRYKKKKTRLTK